MITLDNPSERASTQLPAIAARQLKVPGERMHQLDGFRAVAATLVVLFHAGGSTLSQMLEARGERYAATALSAGMASGVDLFFVLSGVVLLRPYLQDDRRLDLLRYFWRRVLRLWPPFLGAWLISGLVVAWLTYWPTWWTMNNSLPPFSWMGWLSQALIIHIGGGSYNFAWWSLTVESIFYLTVPLTIAVARVCLGSARQSLLWMVTTVILAACASWLPWRGLHAAAVPWHLFVLYLPCFAAGVLLARRAVSAVAALLSGLVGLAWCGAAFAWPQLNVHCGWGLFYFGLVALALRPGWLKNALAHPWLVWLGERSYSLFLVHYAVFSLVCHLVSVVTSAKGWRYLLLTRAVELPLALLVAMALFYFIERHFARNLATAGAFWPWQVRHAEGHSHDGQTRSKAVCNGDGSGAVGRE